MFARRRLTWTRRMTMNEDEKINKLLNDWKVGAEGTSFIANVRINGSTVLNKTAVIDYEEEKVHLIVELSERLRNLFPNEGKILYYKSPLEFKKVHFITHKCDKKLFKMAKVLIKDIENKNKQQNNN